MYLQFEFERLSLALEAVQAAIILESATKGNAQTSKAISRPKEVRMKAGVESSRTDSFRTSFVVNRCFLYECVYALCVTPNKKLGRQPLAC